MAPGFDLRDLEIGGDFEPAMKPSFLITTFMLVAMNLMPAPSILTTPSYVITIEAHCPEYETLCNHVTYFETDRKTKKTLTLNGREVHHILADGITPGHFLGYEFKNGSTNYFVGEAGEFQMTQGTNVLIEEQGAWND